MCRASQVPRFEQLIANGQIQPFVLGASQLLRFEQLLA